MKFVSFTMGAGVGSGSQIGVAVHHIVSFHWDVANDMVRLDTTNGPIHVKEELGVVMERLEDATQPPAQLALARAPR